MSQNFDGRITQAENDASQALEASRSFENRVQAAITTANNANQTATNAQGIAMRADQNAGAALDKIGDLSQLDTTAKQNLVAAINEALENGGKVDSVNGKTGVVVLGAGDIGYNGSTVESALDGKQNAPAVAGTAGQVLGLDSNLSPAWITPAATGEGRLTPAQEITAQTYIQNGTFTYSGRRVTVQDGRIILDKVSSGGIYRGIWLGKILSSGTGPATSPVVPDFNVLESVDKLKNINNIELYVKSTLNAGTNFRIYYFSVDENNNVQYISTTYYWGPDAVYNYSNLRIDIPETATHFCFRLYFASAMDDESRLEINFILNYMSRREDVQALILENNG